MTEADMRPIVLKTEIDGFIFNRLHLTPVAEALHLVGEGYCTPEDMDAILTDGLALRWASMGPIMHRMKAARTDYDWTPDQIASAHAELAERVPIDSIAERQAWRDRQILALRQLKQKQ